jgi:cellulose synthase/poly-beta-1,6-N-acetylglucosamine synthase-like glycosyltransferase
LESEAIHEKVTLPTVSIIVATLNSESTIDDCLCSILELDYPKQLLQVIVVDGGSKDSTVERVKAHSVKLISTQLNAPAGYNAALRTVKSKIVGFIDSDAKVEKQWLKKLVTHLNSPKVAGASGTIATWNDNKLVPRCIGYELSYRYNRLPKEIRRVATMNLILKKRLIEKVVGYDEALSTQYDTDLGIRLAGAGYKIIFDSSAICYHFHRPTLGQYFRQQFEYGQNTWRLYSKHPQLIKGDEITNGWMNFQPILYVVAAISLITSVITNFNLLALSIFLSIASIATLHYALSAARISRTFHDLSGMFLIVIYFTRAVAWTLGGAISFLRNALTRGGYETY